MCKQAWQYTIDLSPYQKRFYLEWKINPKGLAYNLNCIDEIRGSLNANVLKKSLDLLVNEYYEGCRSYFSEVSQKPSQNILKQMPVKLFKKDISALAPNEKKKQQEAFLNQIAKKQFDLRRPPLFYFGLLKVSARRSFLILSFHHIIFDALNVSFITKMLPRLYAGQLSGAQPPIINIVSVKDYIKQEKRSYSKAALTNDLQYWNKLLNNHPLSIDLNFKKELNTQKRGVSCIEFKLKRELSASVQRYVKATNTTPFLFFSAVFGLLLYRYTQTEKFAISYPVSMKQKGGKELGVALINNLPMLFDFSEVKNFRSLIDRQAAQRKLARQHQRCSLTEIILRLRKEGRVTSEEILNVSFAATTLRNDPMLFEGCQVRTLMPKQFELANDLYLCFQANKKKCEFRLDYKTELFDESLMRQFITHFQWLIECCINKPLELFSNISLLNSKEWKTLLLDWNKTEREYPRHKNISRLFEEQVEKTPNRIAVKFQKNFFSYEDINKKSNQLARYIRQTVCGSGNKMPSDCLIAICMERSIEMVLSIVGILKAGAAYLPIDPEDPPSRIQTIIQHSKPAMILSLKSVIDAHSDLFHQKPPLFCLDCANEIIEQQSSDNIQTGASPNDLAYVIYTSGSTGSPKGVAISQTSVVNRLFWMQKRYQLRRYDVVLQKTPYTFDVSVWEFLWPLMTGATLVIAEPGGHKDSAYLARIIKLYKVTTLHFVPTMFRLFMEVNASKKFPSLRRIICSGEALPTILSARFLKRFPSCKLYNLYGPTEATVDVSAWQCHPLDATLFKTTPIGKPIDNIQLYILDKQMQPVPIGVIGELTIAGVGLARDYFGQPTLTKKQFLLHEFKGLGFVRLYKTGDLVRFLSDGNIQFEGRTDHQIKLRGFRIELEEIEIGLMRASSISKAVVLVREEFEKRYLVAFIQKKKGARLPSNQSLIKFLADRLPEYMVPNVFLEIASWPITSSGKLDKKALLHLVDQRRDTRGVMSTLNSLLEKKILTIWQAVLKRRRISVEDNFFQLGGDSILAVSVAVKLQTAGIKLSAIDLLSRPTITALSTFLVQQKQAPNELEIPLHLATIPSADRQQYAVDNFDDLYQLSELQKFMLAQYEAEKKRSHAYHFQEALYFYDSSLNQQSLREALWLTIKQYPILRTVMLAQQGDGYIQAIKKELSPSVLEFDLSLLTHQQQAQKIKAILRKDRADYFNIEDIEHSLCRFYLIKISRVRFVFIMVFHHVISDGWSNAEFLSAFLRCYDRLRKSGKCKLAVQKNSFKEWVAIEKESLARMASKRFWMKEIAHYLGEQCPLFNPLKNIGKIDYLPWPEVLVIPSDITTPLINLAKRYAVSVKIICFSAFLQLISEHVSQRRFIVGVVTNGRTARLKNPLHSMGLFWNLLPFGVDVDRSEFHRFDLIWTRLQKLEKQMAYPFTQISQDCKVKALFEAVFNFVNFHNVDQALVKQTSLSLERVDVFDNFHFPLNFTAAYSSINNEMKIFAYGDSEYFSQQQANQFLTRYQQLLKDYSRLL